MKKPISFICDLPLIKETAFIGIPTHVAPLHEIVGVGSTVDLQVGPFIQKGITAVHTGTQYQLTEVGTDFSSPMYDTVVLPDTPCSIGIGFLKPNTQYKWRARHISEGLYTYLSDWSEPTIFTTDIMFGTPWENWDGVDIASLASEDTFIVKFISTVAGSGETGIGGPASITSRSFSQNQNVPGATTAGRKLGPGNGLNMTGLHYFRNVSNLAPVMMQDSFSILLRLNNTIGDWSASWHPSLFRFNKGRARQATDGHIQVGSTVGLYWVDTTNVGRSIPFGLSSTNVSGQPTTWYGVQYDKATRTLFYGVKVGTTRPVKMTDFTQQNQVYVNTDFIMDITHLDIGATPVYSNQYTYLPFTAHYAYFMLSRIKQFT